METNYTQLINFGLILAIIVLGTLGNVVSFIVFYKGKICRTLACSTYFRCLAVADTFVLLFPGLQLLMYLPPISFQYNNLNAFFCKASTFNVVIGAQVSAWIIVIVTVERTMTICRPLQFRVESSFFRPYLKIAAILLFFAASNCFYLVDNHMMQYTNNNNQTVTGVNRTENVVSTGNDVSSSNDLTPGHQRNATFSEVQRTENDLLSSNISAFGHQRNGTFSRIQSTLNTVSFGNDAMSGHQRNATFSSVDDGASDSVWVCYPTSLELSNMYTIVSIGVFSFIIPLVINLMCNLLILYQLNNRLRDDGASSRRGGGGGGGSTKSGGATKRGSMRSMMYRVMAISVVHIVSTGPLGMLMFLDMALVPSYVMRLFNALYYLNSGVNFLFYCVTGRDFRHDFTELFVCRRGGARPYAVT